MDFLAAERAREGSGWRFCRLVDHLFAILLRSLPPPLCAPNSNKTSQTFKTNQAAAAMVEGPSKTALVPLLLILLCALSLQQAAAASQDPWQVGLQGSGIGCSQPTAGLALDLVSCCVGAWGAAECDTSRNHKGLQEVRSLNEWSGGYSEDLEPQLTPRAGGGHSHWACWHSHSTSVAGSQDSGTQIKTRPKKQQRSFRRFQQVGARLGHVHSQCAARAVRGKQYACMAAEPPVPSKLNPSATRPACCASL